MIYRSIQPRYTSGSPAKVPRTVAEFVANQEVRAYEEALAGRQGPAAQAVASSRGLDRIVVEYYDDRGTRHCIDLITDKAWDLPLDGRHLDIHAKLGEVRGAFAWEEQGLAVVARAHRLELEAKALREQAELMLALAKQALDRAGR